MEKSVSIPRQGEVSHQLETHSIRQGLSSYLYLWACISMLSKSEETKDIAPITTFHFSLHRQRLKVLTPPDPFKIRRTKLSQLPGQEATLMGKAKRPLRPSCLTPSEHLTKVLEYFQFLDCSRILRNFPEKREIQSWCFYIFFYYHRPNRKKKTTQHYNLTWANFTFPGYFLRSRFCCSSPATSVGSVCSSLGNLEHRSLF